FLYRLRNDSFSEGRSPHVEDILSAAQKTFEDSLDDDLNISGALGALFEMIYKLNKLADKSEIGAQDVPEIEATIRKMDEVFGVATFPEIAISEEIEALIQKRNEARRNKDYSGADEIRDRLLKQGIILEDTPGGTRWKKS
ncbi:MAG: DALR domain-containing protein, partial [Acidobacteriota bacterium]